MRARAAATLIVVALAAAGPVDAQTIAITDARVHTAAGPALENATVVIQDGTIADVGADIDVPAGARVIDGAGKVVTPGFFDSSTQLGLVEVGAYASTRDMRTSSERISAAFNVVDGINRSSSLIPVTRVEGITRAVVVPSAGESLVAGQGVVMDLSGDAIRMSVHRSPAAMYAVLGDDGARRAGGARGAAVTRLREVLQDARDFAQNREAYAANRRRAYAASRLDLEALVPVVRGDVPLAVRVDREDDILATLRLSREFDLDLILLGAIEAWKVADRIAAADVPVIIDPFENLPRFSHLGATLENAARLHAAGVTVAFASFDAHNSRKLKQGAGIAVAYGMPHEAALRAVTSTPAEIWGVDDRYGAIEPGLDADLVVWSGDPFELTTSVERVFIRGREVADDTRQHELFRRYRELGEETPQAYEHR